MMMFAAIALVTMIGVSWSILVASCDVGLTSSEFERTVGYLVTGDPFQRLTNNRLNYCIMICTESVECKYMNVFHEVKEEEDLQCELFNVSTILNETTLTSSEYSTFYKAITFKDCLQAKVLRKTETNGLYSIILPSLTNNQAYCDMETDGGGWTAIQRRIDGSLDFARDWQSFKIGFGNLESNFWLGLDAINLLTKDGLVTLRFDLWNGSTYYSMEYYDVTIADETDNYRLNWQSFAGNTTNSMMKHKNMQFTTKDSDNDFHEQLNCAVTYGGGGGWWYENCLDVSLNGVYGSTDFAQGIIWDSIVGKTGSLTKTEMKVKLNG